MVRLISFSLLICSFCLTGCGSGDGLGDPDYTDNIGSVDTTDPIAETFPIVFIKRPLSILDEDGETVAYRGLAPSDAFTTNPGAQLIVKEQAVASAPERVLTAGIFEEGELYDVRDIAVNYDATKIAFAMRAPLIENADDEDQPKWNLWEFDRVANTVEPLIKDANVREKGHDLSPVYLSDGKIVFASDRQKKASQKRLEETNPKPAYSGLVEDGSVEAFNLHLLDTLDTGQQDISQITFNENHDFYPTLIDSGEIVYSRWDASEGKISLYKTLANGVKQSLLYGYDSHASTTGDGTIQFLRPKPMPNGQLLVTIRENNATGLADSNLVLIDTENFINADEPVPSMAGMSGSTQTLPTILDTVESGEPVANGHILDFTPLWDGTERSLMIWSQCRFQLEADGRIVPCSEELLDQYNGLADGDTTIALADPLYGIWMYNTEEDTQLPVVLGEEGYFYSEVAPVQDRTPPNSYGKNEGRGGGVMDAIFDDPLYYGALEEANLGIMDIRSIYDLDGAFSDPNDNLTSITEAADITSNNGQRTARFIRIYRPVAQPDNDVADVPNNADGVANNMREIVGYAPIQPDGSVIVTVPADTTLGFEIVNEQGSRISGFTTHRTWFSVAPGEAKTCNGCHSNNSTAPHGRLDDQIAAVNAGNFIGSFPNATTDIEALPGDTMAMALARYDNDTINLSLDMNFTDHWTPDTGTPLPDINLSYLNLPANPSTTGCVNNWQSTCTAIINYENHIQPIWEASRPVYDPDDPTVQIGDNQCIGCHTETLEDGTVRDPVIQLDLSNRPSDTNNQQNVNHFFSYHDLLERDNTITLNEAGNAVEDLRVPDIDPISGQQLRVSEDPQQTFEVVACPVAEFTDADGFCFERDPDTQYLTTNNPSNSRLFQKVNEGFPGETVNHAGFLSDDELRLLREWLDIGAQYYNNPFDAVEE